MIQHKKYKAEAKLDTNNLSILVVLTLIILVKTAFFFCLKQRKKEFKYQIPQLIQNK